MSNEAIVRELNHLLTRNYDSEKGYTILKNESKHPLLRAYFQEKIAHRYHYGHQIKDLIRGLDGEVDKGGSIEGGLHRTWLDIKAYATGNDEEALLEEVERGEKVYLGAYDKFLELPDLPDHIRNIIERQRQSVKITLGDVEQLEEFFED